MKSTSGLSICPRNCRAYADSDSTYRRCPSAKIVSNARLDFPDPDRPVKTIRESRGSSSDTSLRLCSRAPLITSWSATALPRVRRRARSNKRSRSYRDGTSRPPPLDTTPVCRHAIGRDGQGWSCGDRGGEGGERQHREGGA